MYKKLKSILKQPSYNDKLWELINVAAFTIPIAILLFLGC